MVTEVTHSVEEFGGHINATTVGQFRHASLDDRLQRSVAPDGPSLAEQFAGIVYFSEMTAERHDDRRPTSYRAPGTASGIEPVGSARGRRASARPWRLPAISRNARN
jgi:hypothetical protein